MELAVDAVAMAQRVAASLWARRSRLCLRWISPRLALTSFLHNRMIRKVQAKIAVAVVDAGADVEVAGEVWRPLAPRRPRPPFCRAQTSKLLRARRSAVGAADAEDVVGAVEADAVVVAAVATVETVEMRTAHKRPSSTHCCSAKVSVTSRIALTALPSDQTNGV